MKAVLKILVFLLLPLSALCQNNNDSTSLRIIFCGDLMGHGGQIKAAKTADGYDYSPCFKFVEGYLKDADLAVANLELTLAGPPYSGYPQFSSPDEVLVDAHSAGFGLFTTVNNHCMDSGKHGFLRTLHVFDSLGIPHLGTYRDMAERQTHHPLMMYLKGFRLAFLTYTYGTNGLPVPEPLVANLIDTTAMAADIVEAHKRDAEYVIAMIHWGIEYDTVANREQRNLAQFLLSHGADIVIGGHPHVVQDATMDALPDNDKTPEIVVYSMGNLVSNQRFRNSDGGIMIELHLHRDGEKIAQDCYYMPYWVYRGVYNGLYQYYILPSFDARQNPENYQLSQADLNTMIIFDDNTRERLSGRLKECSYHWVPDDNCSTERAIREMCHDILDQYPLATLQDIYKTCYQDFFGAEHLMNDTAAARQYIHYELEQCRDTDLSLMPKCEPTGFRHRFMRVNFTNITEGQLTEEELVTMFVDAAGKDNAFSDDWPTEWQKIEDVALKVNPLWADDTLQSSLKMAAKENHAVRHSDAFRNNYNPHYRIVRNIY